MQMTLTQYVDSSSKVSLRHLLLIKLIGEKEIYKFVKMQFLSKYPYKGTVEFMYSVVVGYKNFTVYKINNKGLITVVADIEMENGRIVTDMMDFHIKDVANKLLHRKTK